MFWGKGHIFCEKPSLWVMQWSVLKLDFDRTLNLQGERRENCKTYLDSRELKIECILFWRRAEVAALFYNLNAILYPWSFAVTEKKRKGCGVCVPAGVPNIYQNMTGIFALRLSLVWFEVIQDIGSSPRHRGIKSYEAGKWYRKEIFQSVTNTFSF